MKKEKPFWETNRNPITGWRNSNRDVSLKQQRDNYYKRRERNKLKSA